MKVPKELVVGAAVLFTPELYSKDGRSDLGKRTVKAILPKSTVSGAVSSSLRAVHGPPSFLPSLSSAANRQILFQGLDSKFLVYELLKDHLSHNDLIKLGTVCSELKEITKPITDLARICEPESVYPHLSIRRDHVTDPCLELLNSIFNEEENIHFKSIMVSDWRLLLPRNIPVTHLVIPIGAHPIALDEIENFALAVKGFQGKVSLESSHFKADSTEFFSIGLIALAETMTSFEISRSGFTRDAIDSCIAFGSIFAKATQLRSLQLKNPMLPIEGWIALEEGISKGNSLRHLNTFRVFDDAVTSEMISMGMSTTNEPLDRAFILGNMIKNTHIESFSLNEAGLRSGTVTRLAIGLSGSEALKKLEWISYNLGNEDDSFAQMLSSLKGLRSISLDFLRMSEMLGINGVVESLGSLTELEELKFRGSWDEDKTVVLGNILPLLKNLQVLLIGTLNSEAAVKKFSSVIVQSRDNFPNLREVNITLRTEMRQEWSSETKSLFLRMLQKLKSVEKVSLEGITRCDPFVESVSLEGVARCYPYYYFGIPIPLDLLAQSLFGDDRKSRISELGVHGAKAASNWEEFYETMRSASYLKSLNLDPNVVAEEMKVKLAANCPRLVSLSIGGLRFVRRMGEEFIPVPNPRQFSSFRPKNHPIFSPRGHVFWSDSVYRERVAGQGNRQKTNIDPPETKSSFKKWTITLTALFSIITAFILGEQINEL